MIMNAEEVASALDLVVVERLSGGIFGASIVTTPSGSKAVFKVLPDDQHWSVGRVRRAVGMAERMREDGYPIPRFLDVGVAAGRVFTLQELINGTTPDRLLRQHAESLIKLQQHQVGIVEPDPGWATELVHSIRANDGEVQTLLRSVGTGDVLVLLDEVLAIGEHIDPAAFNTSDVVHGDFGAYNALVHGEDVVAVIDWEGARVGDSRADLVNLACYSTPENADADAITLLENEIAAMPHDVSAALTAKFVLDKLYFALRIGDHDTLQWTIGLSDRWARPRWRQLLSRR